MTPLFRKFLSMNWLLTLFIAGLLTFGVYSIYSAGFTEEKDSESEVQTQAPGEVGEPLPAKKNKISKRRILLAQSLLPLFQPMK